MTTSDKNAFLRPYVETDAQYEKRKTSRLVKLVERVEEDLDIFLNDKSMTNEQAFKEIGAKLYEVDGLTWKGGFVVKIAEQLILENIEEENI